MPTRAAGVSSLVLFVRTLSTLALGLVLAVACSSGGGPPPGASSGPQVTPPAPPPSGMLPPSPGQPPPSPPSPGHSPPLAATATPPSPATHADPELEAMMPAHVRGVTLSISSIAAPDLAGSPAEASLTELAERVERPLSDITLAAAVDPTGQLAGGINAIRLRGGSGADLLGSIVELEQRSSPAEVSQEVIAGRNVTRLTQGEGEVTLTRFLYATGEVVFVVLSPDQTTATAFIEALP